MSWKESATIYVNVLSCFPLRILWFLAFHLSINHFEFIFVCGVRKCSHFILLHTAVQFPQHHLLKRLSFVHCVFLSLWSKMRWPQVHGFISGLSVLSHWSIFLFLCQESYFCGSYSKLKRIQNRKIDPEVWYSLYIVKIKSKFFE